MKPDPVPKTDDYEDGWERLQDDRKTRVCEAQVQEGFWNKVGREPRRVLSNLTKQADLVIGTPEQNGLALSSMAVDLRSRW